MTKLTERYPYLDVLAKAVQTLPSKAIIVELGCWWGKATAAMARVAGDRTVYATDHFKGSANWLDKPQFEEFNKMGLARGFKTPQEYFWTYTKQEAPHADIRLGEGEFDHAVLSFHDNSIDMLFVDGDHMQTAHDLITWYPKMKSGGIVFCHDVDKQHYTVGEEFRIFCEFHDKCWDMDGELGWFRK